MGKLRLRHHLNGIIPFAGSLESQLAGVSDQVVGSLQAVHRVALRRLIAQSHLQLVLPLHLLLVVIVGLHGESTQQRIVALATLVPVVRHVVLEELQIVIACESPEVRSEDDDVHRCRIRFNCLRCHILNDVALLLLVSVVSHDRCAHLFQMVLGHLHQVGASQIDIQQGSIQFHIQRITHSSLRLQSQESIGRRAIERERSKELGKPGIIRIHPDGLDGIDTGTQSRQRISITLCQGWLHHFHSIFFHHCALVQALCFYRNSPCNNRQNE